jgi:hypothetical protein
VEAETASELRDAGLALTVPESQEERRGAIDRSDCIAVKNRRRALPNVS